MFLTDCTPERILEAVQSLNLNKKQTVLLLFGEQTDMDYSAMIQLLNQHQVSFFGGLNRKRIFFAPDLPNGAKLSNKKKIFSTSFVRKKFINEYCTITSNTSCLLQVFDVTFDLIFPFLIREC